MADSLLPARLAPSALPRLVRSLARAGSLQALRARQLVEVVRTAGLEPVGITVAPPADRLPPGAPVAVVVHEPGPPEQRAALLGALSRRTHGPLLAVTPAEWTLLGRSSVGAHLAAAPPVWGELPPPTQLPEPDRRRRDLRRVAGLHLGRYASALARRDRLEAARCARWLRDELELLAPPSRFPPRPEEDADDTDREAALLGAFHAVFAAEVAVDDGDPVPGEACPQGTAGEVDELADALLADLPPWFDEAARALYLLPGPLGTRRSWQLVAVVDDSASLVQGARLRFRLDQHVAMLPRELTRGLLGSAGPAVLTSAAAAGLVRRRLTERPSRRLAIRLHRRLVTGEDVLRAALVGPDLTPDDLHAELAALLLATSACWRRDSSESAFRELAFGAWPAVLHLLRGGPATAPLHTIHEALAPISDPAVSGLARRGERADARAPSSRGRPTTLVRDLGPALIRIQEVAFETEAAR